MTAKRAALALSWTWKDGQVIETSKATVGVLDRGFLYGDSIFETFRTIDGRSLFLPEHLDRFRDGAKKFHIELSHDDEFLKEVIEKVISKHPVGQDSVVRMTLTRGDRVAGEIGFSGCQSRLLVTSTESHFNSTDHHNGIDLVIVAQRKIPPQCLDPMVKNGNYLGSIFARNQAQEVGADDGVLLSPEGVVTEATSANLFWVRDGVVYTCREDLVLAGITRAKVIDLLQLAGISVVEDHFQADHLLAADEVFLTGSVQGVQPVASIDGRALSSCDNGSLTRRCAEGYQDLVAAAGSRSIP
jgi:branched-chain amino acid aminotransferase